MTVIEKLSRLRSLMKQNGMDLYIIPTDDFHASEYVGDYFKAREYMSGFTGSAGTLVVTAETAALFTDGRYFIQAKNQLEGSTIELKKMFTPGVPDIISYIAENTQQGGSIGFDGRTVSASFAKKLREKTKSKAITFASELDLVGEIWQGRPALSSEPVWILDEKYAGMSAAEKLEMLRESIKSSNADLLVISALDEIAWALNLRGGDIECTPVFLAFLTVGSDTAALYCSDKILDDEVREYLRDNGVSVKGYEDIYTDLSLFSGKKTIMIDPENANYSLKKRIADSVKLIEKESPASLTKAKKTDREIENIKNAHLKDGIAVTRFIRWLKKNAGNSGVSELSAAKKLEEFRKLQPDYISDSFAPIIAYGAHGAIIHYEPTESTDVPILKKGFCLCDTGAHYIDGTTDVTRTVAAGVLTDEEKRMFTLALKGHLNLSSAVFPKGASGENLDVLARQPLWENGIDYNHGTGHGVGFVLSVHEGPQRINWKIRDNSVHYPLEKGMVVSNEPGVYIENKFGVRHENLMYAAPKEETQYGEFMRFENLTLVPFDKEAIDFSLFSQEDKDRLNAYHKIVYEKLSPYFEGEELLWLKNSTSPV